jgi:hypothetical protein
VDDSGWQQLLERHDFWRRGATTLDEDHASVAFHILYSAGKLASRANGAELASKHEFDAVRVPEEVFADADLAWRAEDWAAMHGQNCGAGYTGKMGIYVIKAGGTLGYHVDGPVFLKGERVDLSGEEVQEGLVALHASRRTILPLRFNAEDEFLVCRRRVPLARGRLFEFSNVLPHAYFNRGPEDAALLVTTYVVDDLIPEPADA